MFHAGRSPLRLVLPPLGSSARPTLPIEHEGREASLAYPVRRGDGVKPPCSGPKKPPWPSSVHRPCLDRSAGRACRASIPSGWWPVRQESRLTCFYAVPLHGSGPALSARPALAGLERWPWAGAWRVECQVRTGVPAPNPHLRRPGPLAFFAGTTFSGLVTPSPATSAAWALTALARPLLPRPWSAVGISRRAARRGGVYPLDGAGWRGFNLNSRGKSPSSPASSRGAGPAVSPSSWRVPPGATSTSAGTQLPRGSRLTEGRAPRHLRVTPPEPSSPATRASATSRVAWLRTPTRRRACRS